MCLHRGWTAYLRNRWGCGYCPTQFHIKTSKHLRRKQSWDCSASCSRGRRSTWKRVMQTRKKCGLSLTRWWKTGTATGWFSATIKGLVYEEEDNIHIIYDTDRYTLPNMQDLELVLSATRDDEQIPVMPLVETIQKYACSLSGTERARCQIILDAINQHGMKVSRKELRHILNLKSNLGKQINRFIFEESGVLIGNALKSARNKEALFGGVLGIRHFCKDDAQYYYSGYLGKSINRSFPHACRIRKVCSTGQTLQFQRYLPLLEVDFIRANGWTVIPFPFKYLREWRLQQG